MRLLLPLALIILLSSCAETMPNYYVTTARSWDNGSVNTLLQRWGNPDQKITIFNGNTAYIYRKRVRLANKNESKTKPATMITCVTAFEVNPEGIVVHVQVKGHGCYGDKLFAESKRNPMLLEK